METLPVGSAFNWQPDAENFPQIVFSGRVLAVVLEGDVATEYAVLKTDDSTTSFVPASKQVV